MHALPGGDLRGVHDARGRHQSLSCMLEGAWRNGGGRVGQTHVRDSGSPVDYCSDVAVLYRLVLGGRGSIGAVSRIYAPGTPAELLVVWHLQM